MRVKFRSRSNQHHVELTADGNVSTCDNPTIRWTRSETSGARIGQVPVLVRIRIRSAGVDAVNGGDKHHRGRLAVNRRIVDIGEAIRISRWSANVANASGLPERGDVGAGSRRTLRSDISLRSWRSGGSWRSSGSWRTCWSRWSRRAGWSWRPGDIPADRVFVVATIARRSDQSQITVRVVVASLNNTRRWRGENCYVGYEHDHRGTGNQARYGKSIVR